MIFYYIDYQDFKIFINEKRRKIHELMQQKSVFLHHRGNREILLNYLKVKIEL